jgi:hypothetical protein
LQPWTASNQSKDQTDVEKARRLEVSENEETTSKVLLNSPLYSTLSRFATILSVCACWQNSFASGNKRNYARLG